MYKRGQFTLFVVLGIVLFPSFVFADGSLFACEGIEEQSFSFYEGEVYYPRLENDFVEGKAYGVPISYNGCTVSLPDSDTFLEGISFSFDNDKNDGFILVYQKNTQGKLFGYDADFPEDTTISFSKNGARILFFDDGKGSLLQGNQGLVFSAEGGDAFTFLLTPLDKKYPEQKTLDITFDDSTLLLSSANDEPFSVLLNDYLLTLQGSSDRIRYDGEKDNLEVTLHEQDSCKEGKMPSLDIGVYDARQKNITASYLIKGSFDDSLACNTKVILLNAAQKSYDKQFEVVGGSDALAYDFVVLSGEPERGYSFVMNTADILTLKKEKEGVFSGLLDIAAGGKDSVPISIAAFPQYESGSLSDGSSFSFLLDHGKMTMTDCVYYGAEGSSLTFWCGESYPQFFVSDGKDVQGLEYSGSSWTCQKEGSGCLKEKINLFPFTKEEFVRLLPSSFERYNVLDKDLRAKTLYVGDEVYFVKPEGGLVSFEEGSLILKMQGGEVKDNRLDTSYALEEGSVDYSLRFVSGRDMELDSINCCSTPLQRKQGEDVVYGCAPREKRFLSDAIGLKNSCVVPVAVVSSVSLVEGFDKKIGELGNVLETPKTIDEGKEKIAEVMEGSSGDVGKSDGETCDAYTIDGNDGWMYKCGDKGKYYSCKVADPSVTGGPYTTADEGHPVVEACEVSVKENDVAEEEAEECSGDGAEDVSAAAPSLDTPWYVKFVNRKEFIQKEKEKKTMYRVASRGSGCSLAGRMGKSTQKTFDAHFTSQPFSCDQDGIDTCYSFAERDYRSCKSSSAEDYCCGQAVARQKLCDEYFKSDCESRSSPGIPGPLCDDIYESQKKVRAEVGCDGCTWEVETWYNYALVDPEDDVRNHIYFETFTNMHYFKDYPGVGNIELQEYFTGEEIYEQFCNKNDVLYCYKTRAAFRAVADDVAEVSFTESAQQSVTNTVALVCSYMPSGTPGC